MLKKRSEFLRVARGRRKVALPGLVLQAAAWAPDDGPDDGVRAADKAPQQSIRVGYTASRKVGNAVARNRARRRLRAAVAQVMGHARGATDYVVIARRGTLTRSFDGLTGDLERALRRVGAWCGPVRP